MRVLFLTHSYPRFEGDAAGSFLLRLAKALPQHGVDVEVVAPSAPGFPASEVLAGIPVTRFRYAPRTWETLAYTGTMVQEVMTSWRARAALAGFLTQGIASARARRRAFRPDVVHAHWWFPAGVMARWVARRGRLPMVTTMHGTDVRSARATPIARPLFRAVLRDSASVTVVSEWLARETREMAPGIDPLVLPMPAATDIFTPGGSHDPARLLFVGRLNQQKGIEHLVDALPRLPAEARLDVVGDGPARAGVEGRARALGVAERITWHGALPQTALPDLYRRAAALVVPSLGEGFGLVAVEAHLCGTPVIGFASGGLVDAVEHNVTGLLVPPADVSQLVAAIHAVLADPLHAVRMGALGRERALERFAPQAVAHRYAELYRAAVKT